MDKDALLAQIRKRYTLAAGTLDERGRRTLAASEALTVGGGGISLVTQATGLSRATIGLGVKELRGMVMVAAPGRVRRAGGGRKKTVAKDPSVLPDLERLVEPTARGDPQSPLRWTGKGVRKLAAALGQREGPPGQPPMGRGGAGGLGLSVAGQPQDAGRGRPSRP